MRQGLDRDGILGDCAKAQRAGGGGPAEGEEWGGRQTQGNVPQVCIDGLYTMTWDICCILSGMDVTVHSRGANYSFTGPKALKEQGRAR
jgi:hypothetical protein